MAKGYGIEIGDLALVGGIAAAAYLISKPVEDVTGVVPWAEKEVTDIRKDFGHFIDLTDPRKYDWLTGSSGVLANTGNFLGTVGHGIDLTDPTSLVRKNPVTDFFGWVNPFD